MKTVTMLGRSVGERALSQVAAVRLSVRGVRVPLPRQPPSRDRVRGAVPRLDRRRRACIRARSCGAASRTTRPALILAHNHPSGISEPSQADRTITLRLRDALALDRRARARPHHRRRRRADLARRARLALSASPAPPPRCGRILRRVRGAGQTTGDFRLSARFSSGRDRAELPTPAAARAVLGDARRCARGDAGRPPPRLRAARIAGPRRRSAVRAHGRSRCGSHTRGSRSGTASSAPISTRTTTKATSSRSAPTAFRACSRVPGARMLSSRDGCALLLFGAGHDLRQREAPMFSAGIGANERASTEEMLRILDACGFERERDATISTSRSSS